MPWSKLRVWICGVLVVVMLYFPSGIAGALQRLAERDRKGPP